MASIWMYWFIVKIGDDSNSPVVMDDRDGWVFSQPKDLAISPKSMIKCSLIWKLIHTQSDISSTASISLHWKHLPAHVFVNQALRGPWDHLKWCMSNKCVVCLQRAKEWPNLKEKHPWSKKKKKKLWCSGAHERSPSPEETLAQADLLWEEERRRAPRADESLWGRSENTVMATGAGELSTTRS